MKPYILILTFITCLQLNAQEITRSPYSSIGLGLYNLGIFSEQMAMGNTNIALRGETYYSNHNAASLSSLSKSVFNAGFNFEQSGIENTQKKRVFTTGNFSYISLAMPLVKKWKIATNIGLSPYSNIGYDFVLNRDTSGLEISNDFSGNGSINRLYFGFGASPLKWASIGINGSYLFGQSNETVSRHYPNNKNIFSYLDDRSNHFKGFHYDMGIQLHFGHDTSLKHVIGFNLKTEGQLEKNQSRTVITYSEPNLGIPLFFDTVLFNSTQKYKYILPQILSFGYSISKSNIWQINAELILNQFSKFNYPIGSDIQYQDDMTFKIGGFYNKKVYKEKGDNYFSNMRYYAGFYKSKGSIVFEGTPISEYGISFGLGLPFVKIINTPDGKKEKAVSRVNISAQIINRGTTKNNLLKEQIFRATLGINLSDLWFQKNMYN